jgi:hypothetical protein
MQLFELFDTALSYHIEQSSGRMGGFEATFKAGNVDYVVEIIPTIPRTAEGFEIIKRLLPKEAQHIFAKSPKEMTSEEEEKFFEVVDDYSELIETNFPSLWVSFTANYEKKTKRKKKRVKTDEITGTGNAVQVFSTVVSIVDEIFHRHEHVIEILFEGVTSAPSRVKLYNRLAKVLSRKYGFTLVSGAPGDYALVNTKLIQ